MTNTTKVRAPTKKEKKRSKKEKNSAAASDCDNHARRRGVDSQCRHQPQRHAFLPKPASRVTDTNHHRKRARRKSSSRASKPPPVPKVAANLNVCLVVASYSTAFPRANGVLIHSTREAGAYFVARIQVSMLLAPQSTKVRAVSPSSRWSSPNSSVSKVQSAQKALRSTTAVATVDHPAEAKNGVHISCSCSLVKESEHQKQTYSTTADFRAPERICYPRLARQAKEVERHRNGSTTSNPLPGHCRFDSDKFHRSVSHNPSADKTSGQRCFQSSAPSLPP
ncbi:hypothetical protein BKA80DRAFT_253219 [Phyllosticta citrichinensis]